MNDSNQIQEESIQPPIHTKGELQRPKKRKRITEIGSKSTSIFQQYFWTIYLDSGAKYDSGGRDSPFLIRAFFQLGFLRRRGMQVISNHLH
jgi:hypothetical protein